MSALPVRWWSIRLGCAFWHRVVLATGKRGGVRGYTHAVADMYLYLEGLWRR